MFDSEDCDVYVSALSILVGGEMVIHREKLFEGTKLYIHCEVRNESRGERPIASR